MLCKVTEELTVSGIRVSSPCLLKAVAKGCCAKHYQQQRRGRLGRTLPGFLNPEEIKIVVDRSVKKELIKAARKRRLSLSRFCAFLLTNVSR